MTEHGVQPQDPQAEEHVLGACLLPGRTGSNALDTCADLLTHSDFFRPSNGAIYKTMLDMHGRGEPVDVVTLTAALGRDQLVRVRELASLVPNGSSVAHYARIVKDCANKRALIDAGKQLIAEGYGDGNLDRAEQLVYEIANQSGGDVDLSPGADEYIATLQRLRDNPGELIGVPSGFQALDELTQGFIPGNLIIVGARPSMGKSALQLCITANLLGRGLPVGLISLEMSKPEINQRLVSLAASLSGEKLRNPRRMTEEEWARAKDAATRLQDLPLFVREAGVMTPLEVRAQVRRLKAKVPDLAVVFVDYLQLMTTGEHRDNRVQEVSAISRALKTTARDLGLPIVALSQLSRSVEQRTDKRPVLSDLRESGSIEQDADVVCFIYRDAYYNPPEMPQEAEWVEINVAKHRNGPTDTVKLIFKKEQARFSNPAPPRLAGDMGMAA